MDVKLPAAQQPNVKHFGLPPVGIRRSSYKATLRSTDLSYSPWSARLSPASRFVPLTKP